MDAGQRYPASTVVALVIQLPSACLEGPALEWEREEVLGLGRGNGGVLRGSAVQLFWMLRSHGITGQRSGGPETDPGKGAPAGGDLEDAVSSCKAGYPSISRPVLVSMGDSLWLWVVMGDKQADHFSCGVGSPLKEGNKRTGGAAAGRDFPCSSGGGARPGAGPEAPPSFPSGVRAAVKKAGLRARSLSPRARPG